jgi:hypothetical protein
MTSLEGWSITTMLHPHNFAAKPQIMRGLARLLGEADPRSSFSIYYLLFSAYNFTTKTQKCKLKRQSALYKRWRVIPTGVPTCRDEVEESIKNTTPCVASTSPIHGAKRRARFGNRGRSE